MTTSPDGGPCDVLVIGAGPAGGEAALAASGCGLQVVLVDEADAAGGQVYRAAPLSFTGPQQTPYDMPVPIVVLAPLSHS